jgi:hypothetical protein
MRPWATDSNRSSKQLEQCGTARPDLEPGPRGACRRAQPFTRKSTTTCGTDRDLGRRTNSPAYREIEKQALNSRPRTIFDPPRREYLRKYFNVPVENVRKFSRVERISLSQRARLSARAGLHREPARGNSSAQSGMIKTRVRLA